MMRYCIHCGNALSVGASFCHCCGAPLKAPVPETDDVPVVETVVEPGAEPVAEPVAESAEEPVVVLPQSSEDIKEEKEFLDMTHRLLRWERKAWSIAGKVFLIIGIVFAALFLLFGVIIAAADMSAEAVAGVVIMIVYAILFGGIFVTTGIVNLTVAGKIPQYTDTLYKDFRAAHKRCNSIGMIVLCYFFNNVALVFYIINFVRMKCNRKLSDRILSRQGFK